VQGMKFQDVKMTGREIAGHKRAGYETNAEVANV